MLVHYHKYFWNICHSLYILVFKFENFWCLPLIKIWIRIGLNYRGSINSNRVHMALLTEFYCSLIIRASQFSSTTRNLVPRFKRWSKGGKCWQRKPNESSRSWLPFRRGWSLSLMPSFLCFKSPWSSRHPFFGISNVLRTRPRGKTPEERISTKLGIWWWTRWEIHKVPHELYFSEFVECNIRWNQSFKRVGNHSMP